MKVLTSLSILFVLMFYHIGASQNCPEFPLYTELDYTNAVATAPTSCLSGSPAPRPDDQDDRDFFTGSPYDCRVEMGDGAGMVAPKYYAASWYLDNEEMETARENYALMAAIPYETRSAADQMCRHYIDVARVMAYAVGEATASENSADWEEEDIAKNNVLKLWPNPASEYIQVSFTTESFEVEVIDLLGRLKLSKRMNNNERLLLGDWESGIYMLTAVDPEAGARKTIKFVVD